MLDLEEIQARAGRIREEAARGYAQLPMPVALNDLVVPLEAFRKGPAGLGTAPSGSVGGRRVRYSRPRG